MPFEPDLQDPFVAKAVGLRDIFAADAVARDKAGGRPSEQIRLLKESGLPSIQIAKAYGGQGASWLSVLRVVREFARVDGSLAHLYGYHHLPLNTVLFRGSDAQRRDLLSRSASENWVWANSGNVMSKTSGGRRDQDGWILNGFRPFSSGTHIADQIQLAWEGDQGERYFAVVRRIGPASSSRMIGTGSGSARRQRHADAEGSPGRAGELIGSPDDVLTPWASPCLAAATERAAQRLRRQRSGCPHGRARLYDLHLTALDLFGGGKTRGRPLGQARLRRAFHQDGRRDRTRRCRRTQSR